MLDSTVDYLLTGNPIKEAPLLFRRFKTLETLNNEDRGTVITVIDVIIAKRRVEHAIKPVEQQING